MASKLEQLQQIIKQSRSKNEQVNVRSRRARNFALFLAFAAVATAAKYAVSGGAAAAAR